MVGCASVLTLAAASGEQGWGGVRYLAVCRESTASPFVARRWVNDRVRVGARPKTRTPACSPPVRCADAMKRMMTLDPMAELQRIVVTRGRITYLPASPTEVPDQRDLIYTYIADIEQPSMRLQTAAYS